MSAEKLKVGFVGAGGIGSYYSGVLARKGHDVTLFARGDHLEAIRKNGLEVALPGDKFVATVHATDDAADLNGCEYVVVAVKSYSLLEVAPILADAAKHGATILPLLNGVDVAERLEKLGVPRKSIVAGLIAASLFRTEPGKAERRSPFDRMIVGELDGAISDRVQRFVEAYADAGVTAKASENIQLDLWKKFGFIIAMNIASGLTRGPVGEMLSTERGRKLLLDAVHEIAEVSRVAGTPLSQEDEEKLKADVLALPYSTTPSFLADLVRGGPTELDLLAGNVSRLGKLHGVPTPIHDVATTAFEAVTASKANS